MQDGDMRGSKIERETSNFSATYRMEAEILDNRNISGKARSDKIKMGRRHVLQWLDPLLRVNTITSESVEDEDDENFSELKISSTS